MTSTASDLPTVPDDCDLQDFQFMPLDVVRLRDSVLVAESTGDEFRAAVLLWCVAWHQIPAGSLPDNDVVLSVYAGCGRDLKTWRKIRKMAMRGWVKSSDGRFYHHVVTEKACEAWASKLERRKRTEAARMAAITRHRGCKHDATGSVTESVTESVTASKGQGQGQGQGQGEDPPKPPEGGLERAGWLFDLIRSKAPSLTVEATYQAIRGCGQDATEAQMVDLAQRLMAVTGSFWDPVAKISRVYGEIVHPAVGFAHRKENSAGAEPGSVAVCPHFKGKEDMS